MRDPDSGKYKPRRAEAEWVSHRDESLRSISDELFDQVQTRMETLSKNEQAPKGGSEKCW